MKSPGYYWTGRTDVHIVKALSTFLVTLFALLLSGCDAPPASKPLQYSTAPAGTSVTVYRFAVHPLHNPQLLAEAYQPLVDHLNRQLATAGIELLVELEASRDYQAYEEKFRARGPAILARLRASEPSLAAFAQVPMRPPSTLRITTVAGRGRRGLLALPYGQLLTVDGFDVLGAPNWLFQYVVDSPGCWMLMNIVRWSGVIVTPVISQPRGPVMKRRTSFVTGLAASMALLPMRS